MTFSNWKLKEETLFALSNWKLKQEALDGTFKLEIEIGRIRWHFLTGN